MCQHKSGIQKHIIILLKPSLLYVHQRSDAMAIK